MNKLLLESLRNLLLRDLNKLESELLLYPEESSIRKIEKDIKNPAGNLCLHLCGNLQYYIGAILGGTGYQRNRDNEFAARNIPRQTLIAEIEKARTAVANVLPALTENQVLSDYPVDVFGHPMTTLHFLVHLSAHFGYHLGQVNYHRRLVA